jgi:replication initiation protein RepC
VSFALILQPFPTGGLSLNPNGEAMSATIDSTSPITGARRITLTMLTARDRADSFAGLPAGSAKPLRLLAAFQEAEPYLGLPAHAFKLVSWLVKQTMPCDWEEGSRPIAWPSALRQQEFLCLSATQVKTLNRALFEAGIFVIRDNEQGKRYGRRGRDGRIIEAYGFDLSPLAVRYDEFIHLAAEAKVERERMKALRKRVTIARRAIRQAGETLAQALGPLPPDWQRLTTETADLVVAARQTMRSEDLAVVVKSLESRRAEAEQSLRNAAKPVEIDPTGTENRPHTTSTNLPLNPYKDTVIASEKSSSVPTEPKTVPSAPASPVSPEKALGVKPAELVDLAPRLAQYVPHGTVTWPLVLDAADWLRGELGVSRSLWAQACQTMGRDLAALALAIVSTKAADHFSRSAGGYFAGMVRKHERGELRLERSLWALREARYGKADRRRAN